MYFEVQEQFLPSKSRAIQFRNVVSLPENSSAVGISYYWKS